MFKNAITFGKLKVNNPSIWRPIYHIQDACTAFIRAIQAPTQISGVYNVASDNYTLGQIGDIVSNEIQKLSGKEIKVEIDNINDFRNYKVSIEKAKNQLGFSPSFDIKDIVKDLYSHLDGYGDMASDKYYNVNIFKKLGK
jgi:nucleoside-diphosphate-sugar epimerase